MSNPIFHRFVDNDRGQRLGAVFVSPDDGDYIAWTLRREVGSYRSDLGAEIAIRDAAKVRPEAEPKATKPLPIAPHRLTCAGQSWPIRDKDGRVIGSVTLGSGGYYVAYARRARLGEFATFGEALHAANAALTKSGKP